MCGRSHWTLGPGGCLTSERSCVKLCLLERMFAFVNQVSVSAASKSKQATGRVCGLKVEARNLNSSQCGCVSWNSSCVTAAFDSSSSCLGLCWFWFLGHADITPTIRHILVTLFTSHALSSCDKEQETQGRQRRKQ